MKIKISHQIVTLSFANEIAFEDFYDKANSLLTAKDNAAAEQAIKDPSIPIDPSYYINWFIFNNVHFGSFLKDKNAVIYNSSLSCDAINELVDNAITNFQVDFLVHVAEADTTEEDASISKKKKMSRFHTMTSLLVSVIKHFTSYTVDTIPDPVIKIWTDRGLVKSASVAFIKHNISINPLI